MVDAMHPYEVVDEVWVRGRQVAEAREAFAEEAAAAELFEVHERVLVERLHDAVAGDAERLPGPEDADYGEGTYARVALIEDGSEALAAEAGAQEVFEAFGRTGGAWKVEVVGRGADDEIIDYVDPFTVYPGGDWRARASEALAAEAAKAEAWLGRGAVAVELYVIAYVEVDDDGGEGRGEVVMHERRELA